VNGFTFTDFTSSNLTGRIIGSNAQSLNGSRSGNIIAGPYMVVSTYFSTTNALNIPATTVLIDGYTGTIIDLGGNTYQARVQMPGSNGTDRYISVSVPQRNDGVTTGSIVMSTGIVGKTVYYIVNPNIYDSFASRCLS
jgi:hypothetical protein